MFGHVISIFSWMCDIYVPDTVYVSKAFEVSLTQVIGSVPLQLPSFRHELFTSSRFYHILINYIGTFKEIC